MKFGFHFMSVGSHQKHLNKKVTLYYFKRILDIVWRMCQRWGRVKVEKLF